MVRVGALVLLACVLCGCVTRPTADAMPLERSQLSDEAVVLHYVVVAKNPGETELPMRMVSYRLDIDGRRVFRGTRSAEATLSRLSEHSIELPVPVRWEDLPEGEARYRLRGSLGYTLPGIFFEALFEAGLYRPRIHFDLEGTLDPSALRGG